MSVFQNEKREFEDFVHGADVWSKWDAARRLMATKQMQAAASDESFRNSFRELGTLANSGSGIDQLLAIALIVRISDLVKGELRKEATDILSRSLSKPIDGFWIISETKKLPLVSKPSEIRENIASALSHASGDWVIPYVIQALTREEKSSRCRLELTRQLANREVYFSRWLKMISEVPWPDIWQAETPDKTGRLRDLAVALVTSLRERNNIIVDEETGPALATMIQRIAPISSHGRRSVKLSNAAVAIIELLDEVLGTDFTLIADSDAYAALAIVARWWQPSSYPQPVEDRLRSVIRKLTSAIRLRARLGQKSEPLTLRLRQALGAGSSLNGELLKIAETETGLAPEIDDWLRGRKRENSATAGAISSLLSEAPAITITETVAALLLDCIEVGSNTPESPEQLSSSQLRRIRSRVYALAAELKLTASGVIGEAVEFNPSAHRTVSGNIPPDPIVRLRRPMIVRRRDDGSQDIIERALVEETR